MSVKNAPIGIIGLGVMGRNLALNIASHGFEIAGYDKDSQKVKQFEVEAENLSANGYSSLDKMIAALAVPRTVLLLVPAGKPVDSVITDLLTFLRPGDCIIDGGNSHFQDTIYRSKMLAAKGIHLLGMGISGGARGARNGPCMMPGGDRHIYDRVSSILEQCVARVNSEPCIAYCGPGAAGHYVKMVHNGIEYGILQLIAETYDLARRGLGIDDTQLSDMYSQWNTTELESFLIENTATVFGRIDSKTHGPLIDMILDAAKQKGTGRWTAQSAMDLQLPIPTIDAAVGARYLSMCTDVRLQASIRFGEAQRIDTNQKTFLKTLRNAYYAAGLITYGQGMCLLSTASNDYNFNFDLMSITSIWRGGCIIRAGLLELFRNAYHHDKNLNNPLFDDAIAKELDQCIGDLRIVIVQACRAGIPVPAFSSCLSYFDGLRSRLLPANLIQALRDDFGAHTYERIDERGVFHTEWINV